MAFISALTRHGGTTHKNKHLTPNKLNYAARENLPNPTILFGIFISIDIVCWNPKSAASLKIKGKNNHCTRNYIKKGTPYFDTAAFAIAWAFCILVGMAVESTAGFFESGPSLPWSSSTLFLLGSVRIEANTT